MKWSRIKPIVKKEFRQVMRDPRTLGVLFFFPIFLLIMFGYALNFDVKHIKLALYDEDKTSRSREFIQNFLHSEYFDLIYYLKDKREINRILDEKKATIVIVIPWNFSRNLQTGKTAMVQILIDGSNAAEAATVAGYANGIIQSYSLKLMREIFFRQRGFNLKIPVDFRPRVWYNPELRSAKFLIPGLIAFILMISAVVSTSLSVVREKERGTIEQIIVSPIQPLELILGKVIPYILISLLSAYLILLMGYLFFGVSVKGSQLLLFLVTLIYLFIALGTGLFISTISNSQQVAFQLSTILTMLPTFLLSGFVFPIRNMPVAVQFITYLIPARYYLVALRNIMLKGAGIKSFWEEILSMVIFAIVLTGLSWARMRRKKL